MQQLRGSLLTGSAQSRTGEATHRGIEGVNQGGLPGLVLVGTQRSFVLGPVAESVPSPYLYRVLLAGFEFRPGPLVLVLLARLEFLGLLGLPVLPLPAYLDPGLVLGDFRTAIALGNFPLCGRAVGSGFS